MYSVRSWSTVKQSRVSTNTVRLGYSFLGVVVTAHTQLLILDNSISQGLTFCFFLFFFFLQPAGLTSKVSLLRFRVLGTNIDREILISRSSLLAGLRMCM